MGLERRLRSPFEKCGFSGVLCAFAPIQSFLAGPLRLSRDARKLGSAELPKRAAWPVARESLRCHEGVPTFFFVTAHRLQSTLLERRAEDLTALAQRP